MEPNNPDKYYIATGVSMVIDGKHVKAQVKKWYDEEEKVFKEKILSYTRDSRYGEE